MDTQEKLPEYVVKIWTGGYLDGGHVIVELLHPYPPSFDLPNLLACIQAGFDHPDYDALCQRVEAVEADRQYHMNCINRLAVATSTLGEKSDIVVSKAEAALATLEGLVGQLPKWDQLTITHFEADLITKLMCDPSEAGALAGLLRHRQEQP